MRITTDSDGNLWLATESNGVYFVRISNEDEYEINYFFTESGLPTSAYYNTINIDGKVNILTAKGIYKPIFPTGNNLSDSLITFVHDTDWGNKYTRDSSSVSDIIKLSDNKFFIQTSELAILTKENNGTISIDTNVLKKLNLISSGYARIDEQGNINLGTSNSLWIYNPNIQKDINKPFYCLIRSTTITNDSLIFGGTFFYEADNKIICSAKQTKNFIPTLDYEHNSITFEYSATFFENIDYTTYQYQLDGYDNNWSKLSKETKANYTNLNEGNYIFKVKAINVYGIESEIATYEFEILPPWHRTWWAYAIYVILSILLIFIIVKLALSRVVKAKIKLEATVEKRTIQVVEKNEELLQQKEEITAQSEELLITNKKLEIQNNHINSSIRYAKTIQQAILPEKEIIDKYFDNFILYRPKDVVSGDYYWFSVVKPYKVFKDLVRFVAAIDYTGHGVPGAFMSMISSRIINELINEKKIISPQEILTNLNIQIRKSLRQDTSQNIDGLDIYLCRIDIEDKTKITFCGSKLPLLYYSNKRITRVKGDIKRIGGIISQNKQLTFTNTEVYLEKNDIIYLITDGYPDQNNPKRKKIGKNKLIEIFQTNAEKDMQTQKTILEQELDVWQTGTVQRDDITIIGIKI